MYYPVQVSGALFSVGDSHASQGDSELCGTAIESSLTGAFQLILHKKAQRLLSDCGRMKKGRHWAPFCLTHVNFAMKERAMARERI